MTSPVIGVLGGGQLGRMLTEVANNLDVKIVTLDKPDAPAKQINAYVEHVDGSFTDPGAVRELAKLCDVLTVEIEHVNTDVLEDLATGTDTMPNWRLVPGTKVGVQPSWRTIRVIQDKFHQKEHLKGQGIPTAKSIPIESSHARALENAGSELGFPFMLKSRTEAYDGRGNHPIKSTNDIQQALAVLKDRPLYAEKWADFSAELAVMVVKTHDDPATHDWQQTTLAYPVVETVHEDSICKLVYAPARNVSDSIKQTAQELARRAVAGFWGRGVFGVELFLLSDGNLLVNEIAPRPHNSGHYTIEACRMSQYEAHIRAILGWPIFGRDIDFAGATTNAIMLNMLGGAQKDSYLRVQEKARSIPGARIHNYRKGDSRPGRKMGHITLMAESMTDAEACIAPLVKLVDEVRSERMKPQKTANKQLGIDTPSEKTMSDHPVGGEAPLVAVTMGSDSDCSALAPGIALLTKLGIPNIVTITSAHRTPDRMADFAKSAADKGIRVIIAAAGGAAHLPGMIAASTHLPVLGVPVKASSLDGVDSLYSQVQMPKGCPLATFGINNSVNAAQFAARILALEDVNLRIRLKRHLADQTSSVIEKAEEMERVGFEEYYHKHRN